MSFFFGWCFGYTMAWLMGEYLKHRQARAIRDLIQQMQAEKKRREVEALYGRE